jgi:hypothetical protein
MRPAHKPDQLRVQAKYLSERAKGGSTDGSETAFSAVVIAQPFLRSIALSQKTPDLFRPETLQARMVLPTEPVDDGSPPWD